MRHLANYALGVATHTGRVRRANEDDFLIRAPQTCQDLRERGWFVAVADGMGGVPGGAEASRTAVRAAVRPFHNGEDLAPVERMRRAFAEAATEVFELSRESPHLRDMGTTLTIANLL
jgi:serine/threonine protein phosphatase PrpC